MDIRLAFPSRFVKPHELQGRDVTLTIKGITKEMLGHATEKEQKVVVWFKGTEKGLVLNHTNAMSIAKLHGTETDEWAGRKITLYPTAVKAFGATQPAIRVRETVAPGPKPSGGFPAPPLEQDETLPEAEWEDVQEGEETPPDHLFETSTPYWQSAVAGFKGKAKQYIEWTSTMHRTIQEMCTVEQYKRFAELIDPLCDGDHAGLLSILCQDEISLEKRPGRVLVAHMLKYLPLSVKDKEGNEIENRDFSEDILAQLIDIADMVYAETQNAGLAQEIDFSRTGAAQ